MLLFVVLVGFTAVSAQNCSSNCLYGDMFCNPSTLVCTYGCKPGWKGEKCLDQCQIDTCTACATSSAGETCSSCDVGMFGPLCNIECSPTCLPGDGGDTCDFFGNCLYGCEVPWSGPQCLDQHCPFDHCHKCDKSIYGSLYCSYCTEGYYWYPEGNRCIICPQYCIVDGEVCDRITGKCNKCQSGFFGTKCEHRCEIERCSRCIHKNNKITCSACKSGWYPNASGTECLSCDSKNCIGTCDSSSGECKSGCLPGWYGQGYHCDRQCNIQHCKQCALNIYRNTECVSCVPGYYTDNGICVTCPEHCLDKLCEIGYRGVQCTDGCTAGYYGTLCEYQCSSFCVNGTCDTSGNCDCEPGGFGNRCDRQCPVHCVQCDLFTGDRCKACEPLYYGPTCEERCSSNCQPDSYSNYIKCDQDTGKCTHGCIQGYYNDTCDIQCNKNCESHVCDITGKCSAGCTQNHYGDYCENPCPLNCSYVLVGYKRTCDATSGRCLEGCIAGSYGDYCNKTCNERCKDSLCDVTSGECLSGCIAGYTGTSCDIVCPNGCDNPCSPNCHNNQCDKSTQTCSAGCTVGWYGATCLNICNKNCESQTCDQYTGACVGTCVNGYFGAECNLLCSANCADNVCNQFKGYCSFGCKAGYYGATCTDQCHSGCKDNICDRWTGYCTSCGMGRRGQFCDLDCILGTYGENCDNKCGHCYDQQPCNTVHGTCPSGVGCQAGYTGILCQQVLQTGEDSSGVTANLDIVIGCSVAGFICIIVVAAVIVCYARTRNQAKQPKTEEPVVMYSQAHVTIGQPGSENSSQLSDTLLLGNSSSQLNVNLQQAIYSTELFTLYRGDIVKSGRTQSCCVKLVKLTDLQENKVNHSQLTKEYEMLTLCGNHLNIIQLLTTYQNKDVYCAALDSCVETGLVPYLLKLKSESGDRINQPDYMCKMVRFAIDICSALCHIHNMKILHRMVQASHIYLTDSLVAKLGDFHWAEHEEEDQMNELPTDSYPWLPIEVLNYQQFSQSSDVWCFGVTFWELCSGAQQPYDGVSLEEYRGLLLDGSRLNKLPSIHNSMYKVMKLCWRYRPSDRPSAEQILNSLLDLQPRFSKELSVVYI